MQRHPPQDMSHTREDRGQTVKTASWGGVCTETATCSKLFRNDGDVDATAHLGTPKGQQESRPVSKRTDGTSRRFTPEDVAGLRVQAKVSSSVAVGGGDAEKRGPSHTPGQAAQPCLSAIRLMTPVALLLE